MSREGSEERHCVKTLRLVPVYVSIQLGGLLGSAGGVWFSVCHETRSHYVAQPDLEGQSSCLSFSGAGMIGVLS